MEALKGTRLWGMFRLFDITVVTFALHSLQIIPALVFMLLKDEQRYIRWNRFICRCWSYYLVHYWLPSKLKVVITGDKLSDQETYLWNSNHMVDADWAYNWLIARLMGRHGNFIIMLKGIIKYMPFYGTAMMLFGYVFLSRDWVRDKKNIESTLSHLKKETDPFWLVIHSEGTRLKPSSIKESQEFCKKLNLPIMNNCLLPRYKGLNACMHALRSKFDYFVDVTLQYDVDPSQASIFKLCKGLGPSTIYTHIRKYPISTLPHSDDELKNFWYKVYAEKDILLEGFKKDKR
eukprot:TRINITY_DN4311_c0_g1_i1.p1 TRINITY_DN4311_c0_g1~~TRINITY_DN4311_c0_g1_i1.p1  ORF type:complete len:290 (+),score=47.21 TRINITY_DN4311_c0_g1_i1:127-996(+)